MNKKTIFKIVLCILFAIILLIQIMFIVSICEHIHIYNLLDVVDTGHTISQRFLHTQIGSIIFVICSIISTVLSIITVIFFEKIMFSINEYKEQKQAKQEQAKQKRLEKLNSEIEKLKGE